MATNKIDKVVLKSIIREILIEDKDLFKDILKEILVENKVIATKEQGKRREKLESLIDENFNRYEEVFKALA